MEANVKQLWSTILATIALDVSKVNFDTWFKDTFIVKYEDGALSIGVPNEFAKEWLGKKFHTTILKAVRDELESVRSVEYVVVRAEKRAKHKDDFVIKDQAPDELPLSDYYINKNDNLNPRYTFDTFIVGKFNEVAYTAAQAVIREPGIIYNPLFIYGDTGRGKTHLIQAIGNELKNRGMGRKLYYVTSERFAMDYITSVQNRSVSTFKDKYRQYDVIIMDDIQFFAKKEGSQEELFHLFNYLYDNNRHIIFSSDKHPATIDNLEERLKSRFSAGMTVSIDEPDLESRVQILRYKAEKTGLEVTDDILEFLAESIQGNIRDLEGSLNTLSVQTQLKKRPLTLLDVKQIVRTSDKPKKAVSVKTIIKKIADYYDIQEESIYEKTRKREVVKPRQIIMYLLREDYHISYPMIGEKLGGRDHTTVMHSCDKIKNEILRDQTLREEIEEIRAILK